MAGDVSFVVPSKILMFTTKDGAVPKATTQRKT